MAMNSLSTPFSRAEAVALWSRLVAGWANGLNPNGNRTLLDGIPNQAETNGSYEGVTRMLWGLGSWLSYPTRPAQLEWRGVTYDLEALTYRALVNGCDPNLPDSWWQEPAGRQDWDQRTVESGQIALALWQTRERLWSRMSETERGHIMDFLDQVGQRPARWESNWALFWVLNHAARKALNAPYDQTIIDDVMGSYLDGVYCGDGWYDDAARRGPNYFDNYNTWVFASHVLAWSRLDGVSQPQRRDELLERVRAWMQHFPYFFAAGGATIEYGRSLAYKFGRIGAPLWAYQLGAWPHSVGLLKRLVGRHLRWYGQRGAIRPDGTLRQTLTASGSPEVLERYISTGATYWAMQAFSGLWSLPDDDPFWTVEEDPLPAEETDFVKVYPQPGWVLTARQGHVQQFNAGVVKTGYGNKYAKLVYSTRNPFNAGLDNGQPSLDSQLCLSEGGLRGQREHILAYAVGASGWLRSRYRIVVNGHQHTVDTTIIPLGAVHLRAHRIELDTAAGGVTAEEGSAALGYEAGVVPAIQAEAGWLFIEGLGNRVGICPLRGYSAAAQVVSGSPNSVYGFNLLTVLTAAPLPPQHDLVCAVYAGDVSGATPLPLIGQTHWTPDGRFVAQVAEKIIEVPPLGFK
ncbi:MAG TPA: DUF2264 domain-containing protein [Phototrophicaceae bacterium]|nr:DUF2264 domain-containing protein [Phototrophicaceae bacterium]